MRLIDADAFRKKFDGGHNLHQTLQRIIDDEPTVDAVEVVRCKDCALNFEQFGIRFCTYFDKRVASDTFCSCGERKG